MRLADVLGALSLATDLAAGLPMETSLRTCVVATMLARAAGLDRGDLADVYFTALLRHLGCTAYAHEAAALTGGDDHDLIRTFEGSDPTRPLQTGAIAVRRLGAAASIATRVAAVTRALTTPSTAGALAAAQCDQATALASDLGMSDAVVRALGQVYERFDGKGSPAGIAGDALTTVARVLHVANLAEVHHRQRGRGHAEEEVRRRRGSHLDPAIADVFLSDVDSFWPALEATSIWDHYLAVEPEPAEVVADERLGAVALAFARYADLKSPARFGHSPAVARLAAAAARADGLDAAEVETVHRAALLHDLGVVSVPNGIWEKEGPLNPAEWERVRLHAYYTERILQRVPALASVAAIAGAHHERCDGTGYPRGAKIPPAARASRLVACADVYRALIEPRPYRAALTKTRIAKVLRDEVKAGHLDARSVDCVIAAAEDAPLPARQPPAGLTSREVEVLVVLARGLTNKEIATSLGISPRTVQHHIEHIYAKVGVTTRAAAALFAVRSDLVEPGVVPGG